MRALFSVLRTAGPLRRLLPAACLALAADLAGVALMTLAAWLIARAAQQPPMGALSVAIVAVRALAVTRGLFRYGERLAGHDAALRAVARLRSRVFGALARRPAHEDARTVRDADTASRLVADVDLVQDALLRVALPALSALAVSAAAVVCAALVSPAAALVLAVGLTVGGLLLPALTAAASARAARRGATLRAELAVRTVDLLDGAADLRVFGAAERETERAVGTARRLHAHDRSGALLSALSAAALTVVQGATAVTIAVVCAHTAPGVWPVVLPLLALASFEVLAPLPTAAQHLTALPESAHRVAALLHAPRETTASTGPLPDDASPAESATPSVGRPTDGAQAPTFWRRLPNGTGPEVPSPAPATPITDNPPNATTHLSLHDLHVRHHPNAPFALRGVDLELPPGRRVAVVGPSGAGKSTLLAAIARFVTPDRGEILLGGEDLARIPEAALRRTVSGALQDAHVFHTSVRNNLLPARPGATDAQLRDALRRAGLLDWVLSLPARLDTVVGSDGGRLSGGQRRRLVLARALLAAPPLLLLDEPTEGLDPATADAVLADVLASTRGSSLILVTHRTEGLEAVDEVLVMDGGRIVRRGTPRDALTGTGTGTGAAAERHGPCRSPHPTPQGNGLVST
jgi:ATP-binding cassette subfamily C protein CydC